MLHHALLALALALGQHPAPAPKPSDIGYRSLSIEAAQAAARDEKRALVVACFDSRTEAGRAFDAQVLREPVFVRWLEARTVAVRLDLASASSAATSLGVEGPGALVLCTSGLAEVERWSGALETRVVMAQMQPMLKHVDFVAPVRARVKANPNSALARALLGDCYIDILQHDRAIEHFLWAWDHGADEPEFAQMRREVTINKLGQMANRLKTVRKELVMRRDALTASLLEPREGDNRLELARDVAALNTALMTPQKQLETWRALKAKEQVPTDVLVASFPEVVSQYLFRERRFEEFLAGKPNLLGEFDASYRALEAEWAKAAADAEKAAKQGGGESAARKDGLDPLHVRRTATLVSATMYVEALASVGRADDARALGTLVLGVDRRAEAFAALAVAALNGNLPDLHAELVGRARRELTSPAELAQFEALLSNARRPRER
ncbi:MAG: hypothetical protein FJ294_00990 [Planctomycetes bacterium]|nr:hypothetical protein [Planctomycetota bacterium]